MKRLALAAVAAIAVALTLTVTATAVPESSTQSTHAPPAHAAPPRVCTAKAFHPFAAAVWNLDRWRRAKPKPATLHAKRVRLGCAVSVSHRHAMSRQWRRARKRFGIYRLYRQVATHPGPCNGGPRGPADGCWWSIPWQIVCGESGGNFFVNADGAYQIIPSTWAGAGGLRFAPTAGQATPLQQHIIAARLWGTTPWYGLC